MTSGWIILARSKPDADTIGVFVIPPGTRTLTVTPVPSRSFAMIALSTSSAALDTHTASISYFDYVRLERR